MAGQLDRSVFSATEFKMDLTIGVGPKKEDYGFVTCTIPGMSEATSTEFKLNNETRNIITAPGTANNFTFETSFTADYFEFLEAAKGLQNYTAVLTGLAGSAFEGDTITLKGKIGSPSDLAVGVDGVPTFTWVGSTAELKYQAGA